MKWENGPIDFYPERCDPSVVKQRARRRMKRKDLSAIAWGSVERGEGRVAPRKKKKSLELKGGRERK